MVITGQYRSGVAIETANHDGIGSDPIYAIYQIAQPSVLPFLHPFAMSCHVLPECGLVFELSFPSCPVNVCNAVEIRQSSLPFDEPLVLAPEVTGSYLKVWGLVKPC